MFLRLHVKILIASAAALVLCWAAASAETISASGAPPGFEGRPSAPAPSLPLGLDDALSPISGAARGSSAVIPDACDLATFEESEPPHLACWEFLGAIAPGDRDAASIEIEPLARDAARDLPTALEIADLWNSGRHAGAIAALRQFEEAGARVAVGVSWVEGRAPSGLRAGGPDVRIGAPRDNASWVDVDYDAQTGNLFSVVGWGGTTGTVYWTNNISPDHGSTWTQTYEWYTSVGLIKVDAAVVGDWLYVGYVNGEDLSAVRLRRCYVTTGAVDNAYGWIVALDAGAQTFDDMALATNADDFDNRVYCFGAQDDGVLRFAWATSTGTSFTTVATPASVHVAYGLSACWASGRACGDFLYISYLGTDGNIHVLSWDDPVWTDVIVEYGVGSNRNTSISVYETNVICAFEYSMTHGTGIRYEISYDCGSGWNYADLAEPDGVTAFSFGRPCVDARNGLGTAIVYWGEEGEPDHMYYRSRTAYAPGQWAAPSSFSDHDVLTGTDTAMNPLSPAGTPGAFDLGAMYIGGGARIPYFDRPDGGLAAVPETPAGTPALRLLPASPNPFRDQTTLRFELPAAEHARLELFDLLGRHVATVLDEDLGAGAHEVALDGRGLRSGLCLYRLTSGTEVGNGQLILIP